MEQMFRNLGVLDLKGLQLGAKVFLLCTKGMKVARGWKEGRGAEGSLKYRPNNEGLRIKFCSGPL